MSSLSSIIVAILNFLTSEQGIALIGWLGAAVAGKWAHSTYRQKLDNALLARCEVIVEAAVEQTYRQTVAAWKRISPEGKLTPEQMTQAQDAALGIANQTAYKAGIDLAAVAAPEVLRLMVTHAVSRLQGGPAELPVTVKALFP